MKKLLFLLILSFSTNSFSNGCPLENDTLYYINVDIRASSNYPIIMSGVIKELDLISFSKENVASFLKSFYDKCDYSPDIYSNYNSMILECFGDKKGHKYIEEHHNDASNIVSQLSSNSIKETFILDSGENVFISITQISGSFWLINKNSKELLTNSLEIDIKNIGEISTIIMPFDIYYYKKPKRKYLRSILK